MTTVESSDSIVGKIQKHLDGLKAKNGRLAEENQRLKSQLQEAKATHSRIRRIPKKPAEEPAADAPPS